MKRRLYLSLPISGYDIEERMATARAVADKLSDEWDVVVPTENGLPPTATTHEHMRRDIGLLLSCDAVYFMEKWTHSAGCLTEFHVATAIGLEVIFDDCPQVRFR